MEQRLTFITLGVKDYQKARQFYVEKFGWKPMLEQGDITFFKLNGIILSIFPLDELAKDAQVSELGNGFKKFTLAINMRSEQEVDDLFQELKSKGVKMIKAPQKVFWGGYSGYIADLDENLWEIAYNPFLQMDEVGNVIDSQ